MGNNGGGGGDRRQLNRPAAAAGAVGRMTAARRSQVCKDPLAATPQANDMKTKMCVIVGEKGDELPRQQRTRRRRRTVRVPAKALAAILACFRLIPSYLTPLSVVATPFPSDWATGICPAFFYDCYQWENVWTWNEGESYHDPLDSCCGVFNTWLYNELVTIDTNGCEACPGNATLTTSTTTTAPPREVIDLTPGAFVPFQFEDAIVTEEEFDKMEGHYHALDEEFRIYTLLCVGPAGYMDGQCWEDHSHVGLCCHYDLDHYLELKEKREHFEAVREARNAAAAEAARIEQHQEEMGRRQREEQRKHHVPLGVLIGGAGALMVISYLCCRCRHRRSDDSNTSSSSPTLSKETQRMRGKSVV